MRDRPAIVLVHGAWGSPAKWDDDVQREMAERAGAVAEIARSDDGARRMTRPSDTPLQEGQTQ